MKKGIFLDTKFSFKDAPEEQDDKGIISGHAAVFDNVDLVFDIIEKGAFKKTIKDNPKWPILKDHDARQKIGFNLEAKEDFKGLHIKEQLDLNTQLGREVFSLAKMAHEIGAKDALSIGYSIIKEEWEKTETHQIRRIKEIRMFEHSHVTFPANPEAYSDAVKHWSEGRKDLGLLDHVEFFYRHLVDLGFSLKDINDTLTKRVVNQNLNPLTDLEQSIQKAISVLKSK